MTRAAFVRTMAAFNHQLLNDTDVSGVETATALALVLRGEFGDTDGTAYLMMIGRELVALEYEPGTDMYECLVGLLDTAVATDG